MSPEAAERSSGFVSQNWHFFPSPPDHPEKVRGIALSFVHASGFKSVTG